jgi:hypothetical protein
MAVVDAVKTVDIPARFLPVILAKTYLSFAAGVTFQDAVVAPEIGEQLSGI